MFEVAVNVFAGLRNELGFSATTISISDGGTVKDILDTLGLSCDRALIVVLNGQITTKEARLKPGDNLSLFPPVGGG